MSATVVTGPPCSGKSTYVRTHAQPGDIIIDYDTLAQALGSPTPHDHNTATRHVTIQARRAAIAAALNIAHHTPVWIVDCVISPQRAALYQRHHAQIITLDVDQAELHRRASEQRPALWHRLIRQWTPPPAGSVPSTRKGGAWAMTHALTAAAHVGPERDMSWHVVADHAECGEGKFAVVNSDTGEMVACHDSRESADRHMAAMSADNHEPGSSKMYAAAADPLKPYGDVPYADPGYQPDGKKRYPLDSEEHCRAAWSYINMPKNAAKYSSSQLARIKAKIKAAGRRYGIQFADEVKAAAATATTLTGVELARPGTWHLSSGKRTFTEANLRDAADFYNDSGQARIPLGFGHTDNRFDGDPAFGWVSNIRYATDDQGPVLLGDLVDVDDWLAAAAPRRWPNRSVEGFANLNFRGRQYSLALTRVALLGATPPAMPVLRSLADMRQAVAAAADSGAQSWFAASTLPEPDLADDIDEDIPDDNDPAALTAAGDPVEEGAGMNLARYREALAGLPDDASDDEVEAALEEAGLSMAGPVPTVTVGTSQQELDQRIAAAAARGGVITIDAAQVQQFQEGMVRASALAKRLDELDRDTVITAAVTAGKFPPARREHYERLWQADPAGTRELIGNLAAGLVPITASGYDADAEDTLWETEYSRLFPPVSAGKGA